MFDKLEEQHYPGLYKAASTASASAQRFHYGFVGTYLILSIVATLASLLIDVHESMPIALTVIFIGTIGLSIIMAYKRYDRIWYNGRAVAESVKTRTWRYMMRAEPYLGSDDASATSRFIGDLRSILSQNRGLGHFLDSSAAGIEPISSAMKAARQSSLQDRLSNYIKNRIDDQRIWYFKKSKYNLIRARVWFGLTCGSQFIAFFLCLLKIKHPNLENLPIDIFIVVGGSCLTWMQSKRFSDLSTSYSLTAHEISLLRSDSEQVDSESKLSEFVKDSENAFSREHTQWVARKDE